jgi:hypothetical protein
MDAQSGLSTALSGGQVMVQKHEANHEEKSGPRFLLVKVALLHIALFGVFFLTGMWAIKDM